MKIMITGASGSGCSTMARLLAERLGFVWLDTDDYLWRPTPVPFTRMRPEAERHTLFTQALEQGEHHVVSGSVMGWGAPIEHGFDVVVYLYIDPGIRLARLREREIERYGAPDPAFLEWAAGYDDNSNAEGRTLAQHQRWLAALTAPVVRLDSAAPPEQLIDALLEAAPWVASGMPSSE